MRNEIPVTFVVVVCIIWVSCGEKPRAKTKDGWKAPPETNVSPSVLKLTRKDFVGTWKSEANGTTFVLRDDGSAKTSFGQNEHYRGTWSFTLPRQLLVRAVIPHKDPKIDDELNAHEMYFRIRQFSGDRFTAEEFDWEELREFSRIKSDAQ